MQRAAVDVEDLLVRVKNGDEDGLLVPRASRPRGPPRPGSA